MRKFKLLLLGLVSVLATQSSQAVIIENVTLGFDSGATWVGTITFNDGYQGMIDTDGYLNGGTHGFANVHFDQTWWEATGQTNPQSNAGLNPVPAGNYNDWLLANPFTMFIGLNWDPVSSTLNGGVVFGSSSDPYVNGNQAYNDVITSFQRSGQSVPDGGATVAMLGLAMSGMVLVRRKMK